LHVSRFRIPSGGLERFLPLGVFLLNQPILEAPARGRGFFCGDLPLRPVALPERLGEPGQPFRELIAAGQGKPAPLHFEIILDRRLGHGDFRLPLAFPCTAEALADFFAEVLEHGALPKPNTVGSATGLSAPTPEQGSCR